MRAWRPEQLAITHFGSFGDVPAHLDALERSLALAAQRARELSVEEFVAATRADIEADADARDAAVYALGAPLDQTYAGLARYWSEAGRRAMSRTVEKPRSAGPGGALGGRWNVIVRNDNHNTFDHVARTLARVIPNVSLDRGYAFADRIHTSAAWRSSGAVTARRPSTTGRCCAPPA